MIDIQSHLQGATLAVRAMPGARKSEVRGEQDGALKVSVTQVAEKGKANKAIIAVLAKQLGLRKSQIQLIAGDTSSKKRFLIVGITAEQLCARVQVVRRDDIRHFDGS
jgi:hypothetical protein